MKSDDLNVLPMPPKYGVGFMSQTPLPEELVEGYRYEQAGRYHNYHVTPEKWYWPRNYYIDWESCRHVIDGFSPNMNKELHVGHLRNLAVAKSLQQILRNGSKFVALLGCSLGVTKAAVEGWKEWTQFVYYRPEVYYDIVLPQDVVEVRDPTIEEIDSGKIEVKEIGALPKVWDGPNGPVIVMRSDGRPLYSYYDLAFAKEVSPTRYITGQEQKEHFESLGLGDKHLPMGLVMGSDGKKMKSRTGDAFSAKEALLMTQQCLGELPESVPVKRIAWNILCWNFLHAARGTNLKFEVEKWVRPESAGLHITYTYARVKKALDPIPPRFIHDLDKYTGTLTDDDAKLLGLSDQYLYYHWRAMQTLDPAPVANFAQTLARALSVAYERERIKEGRESFVKTMSHALWRLEHCMNDLGMFLATEV